MALTAAINGASVRPSPVGTVLQTAALAIVSRVSGHRRKLAVLADGNVLLAEDVADSIEIQNAMAECRRRKYIAPNAVIRRCQAQAIERIYDAAGTAGESARGAKTADRTRAQDLVSRIVRRAAAARASDVRIRVMSSGCEVMCLVFGQLVAIEEEINTETGNELMHALFYLQEGGTGETGYVRSEPQGFSVRGTLEMPLPHIVSGLRIQRGPEKSGDVAMIRLLYDEGEIEPDLEGLGFLAEQCAQFADARAERAGLVVLAGDKGEGKSTTLAHNLALAYRERGGRDHIVTFEDPPELTIPGTVQIPVASGYASDEQREAGFNKWRNHFVRVAPHIGMIQEVRDRATARAVFSFVETGTPIWTTIHVDDLHAIPLRLLNLGVEPHDVCYPGRLALCCHQKLMPILCPECAISWSEGRSQVRDGLRNRLEAWPADLLTTILLRNEDGCAHCLRADMEPVLRKAQAGYRARRIVAETIRPDVAYMQRIRDRDPLGASEYWRQHLDGVALVRRIEALVVGGKVDPRDAEAKHFRLHRPPAEALP